MKRTLVTLPLLAVTATASVAGAQDDVLAEACEDEPFTCVRAPLTFAAEEAVPIEFDFDTGWLPPGSPLQVKIAALLAAHTQLELKGALVADWPTEQEGALRLTAPGEPEGGLLGYHYGLSTSAEAKLALPLGLFTVNWQGPIPYTPQVDFQADNAVVFDAWGWAPGVEASSSTLPVTIAQVDLASVIGADIPGLTGGFQLDAALDLTVGWTNQRIVLQEIEDVTVAGGDITEPEGESFTTKLDGTFAEVSVNPEGVVDYSGVVHLIPSMFVSFLGQTWSIPIVDIPIPFSAEGQPWSFAPQKVHLPLPEVSLSPEVVDFGEVTVGKQTFRSYLVDNAGELVAAAVMTSSDPTHFPLWESALEIAPETSTQGTLRFVPSEPGLHEAELLVASNDPDAPLQVILLRGMGIAAESDPEPAPEPTPEAAPSDAGLRADGGCGCEVGVSSRPIAGSIWWLVAAGGWWRRRRRS